MTTIKLNYKQTNKLWFVFTREEEGRPAVAKNGTHYWSLGRFGTLSRPIMPWDDNAYTLETENEAEVALALPSC